MTKEINSQYDQDWKELQEAALAECSLGNHQSLLNNKCLVCGKGVKKDG